ncbi:VOC family protein [Nocardioides nitrophenolicus]|uniref:VOC family protein n=1 Tax=Nocardioides nitrophenolicus TaxID=60489 RepID=UPI001956F407|nr:VOC family protein [Nocardioides nitrophenolicus]MBM7516733.1 PhnB protein [Nocardioides nitrophenolicus]
MAINLNPYINWRGQAREAMEFYQSVLGGELTVMTFADMGGAAMDVAVADGEADWVMHAALSVSPTVLLMGADHPTHVPGEPQTQQVSISGPSEDEATLRSWWEGLSDGATVYQPLEKAPWGDSFGMLHDKYGVDWLINIAGAPQS